VGAVPGDYLVPPAHQGAAQPGDLGRAVLVLEILTQPNDEGVGEVGVVVVLA
jgi:hypothetical protein